MVLDRPARPGDVVSLGLLRLSASDVETSRLSSPAVAPVLCTPVAVIEVTVATVELSLAINEAVDQAQAG